MPQAKAAPKAAAETLPDGAVETLNGATVETNNAVEAVKAVEPEYEEIDLGNGTIMRTYVGLQAYATLAENAE